jgi:hypothetical protein
MKQNRKLLLQFSIVLACNKTKTNLNHIFYMNQKNYIKINQIDLKNTV